MLGINRENTFGIIMSDFGSLKNNIGSLNQNNN